MVRSDLRSLVQQWVDDPNGGYFTTAIVNTFLNNALVETQKMLIQSGESWYLTEKETVTAANQADYVLPTDFLSTNRVEIVLSGTGANEDRQVISPMTIQQQSLMNYRTGTPQGYILKKNRLALFPCPDSAKTLRIYYNYRISSMSLDTDTPDVAEEYHEYIALLAARDCFLKDDRTPGNLTQKIEAYEKLMKQAMEDRKQDQARMVVTTDEGGYWGSY